MQMLIGIAHIAAIEQERMIQQRAVAVRSPGELVDEIRDHFDVILVDLRELIDSFRIFSMMRTAMESHCRSFALRIGTPGKVSRKQVLDIVKLKMKDLNARDLEGAFKILKGTARSMGIEVEG